MDATSRYKVCLNPWSEVVRLGKERGIYAEDFLLGSRYSIVDKLFENSLPWGEYVDVEYTKFSDAFYVGSRRVYGYMFDYDTDDILKYGNVISDYYFEECDTHIRLISYVGFVWCHKMVGNTTTECYRVGKENE